MRRSAHRALRALTCVPLVLLSTVSCSRASSRGTTTRSIAAGSLPRTRAERTGSRETSRFHDIMRFL